MTIALVAPYGLSSVETGFVYLLGNYLQSLQHQVMQLRCNGVVRTCGRDATIDWRRSVGTCFGCIEEQRQLTAWGNIGLIEMSRFLDPEDIVQASRRITDLAPEELANFAIDGVVISDLVRPLFRSRFAVSTPDPNNKQHEQFFRGLLLAAYRTLQASRQLVLGVPLTAACVVGRNDFMAQTFVAAALPRKVPLTLFEADISKCCMRLIDLHTDRVQECPFIVEDVLTFRNEVTTWPKELIEMFASVVQFMRLTPAPAIAAAG